VKWLSFEPAGYGGRVRAARFERRSLLPLSAACLVANGVRESLGALLGSALTVSLLEPVVPSNDAWSAIGADAVAFRVRGDRADAAIVLGFADASALAAAAFGERTMPTRALAQLSEIEREVVERAVAALAPSIGAICGTGDRRAPERLSGIAGFATYFELVVQGALSARIGIALSREAEPEPAAGLDLDALAAVRLRVRAALGLGSISAGEAAALAAGAIVPIPSTGALGGRLHVGGRTLALGTCGVLGGRYAFLTTGGGQ